MSLGDAVFLIVKECIHHEPDNEEGKQTERANDAVDICPFATNNSKHSVPKLTFFIYERKTNTYLKKISSHQYMTPEPLQVLGSKKDSSFPIFHEVKNPMISRKHITVENREGLWVVLDQGSKNGSFISLSINTLLEWSEESLQIVYEPNYDIRVLIEEGVEIYWGKSKFQAVCKFSKGD